MPRHLGPRIRRSTNLVATPRAILIEDVSLHALKEEEGATLNDIPDLRQVW